MLISPFTRKAIFVCAGSVLIGIVITASVLSASTERTTQKPKQEVTALPQVISRVPKLRVANLTTKNLGTPEAIAVIEILNTSYLAVMSVEISTKKKGNSGGVSVDGLADADNPKVVIAPFGTVTLEMPFAEMIPDAPLAISIAEFSDGTAEGDKTALRDLRAVRKHRQDQQRAEKKKKETTQQ
jgi:hypothetical protein